MGRRYPQLNDDRKHAAKAGEATEDARAAQPREQGHCGTPAAAWGAAGAGSL